MRTRIGWGVALVLSGGMELWAHDGHGCAFSVTRAPIRWEQPDGAVLTLHARGDARGLWFVDEAGQPGMLVAELAVHADVDAAGFLRPTNLPMHGPAPVRWGRLDESAIRGVATDAMAPFGELITDRDAHPHDDHDTAGFDPLPPEFASSTTGTLDNLVILLRFSDHGPGGQDRTLPTTTDIDTMFNAVGGDATLAPSGSIRDFFLENSFGLLSVDSTLVAWVDVPNTEVYYANGAAGLSTVTFELVADALALADPLVDFADYDGDGDGLVDSITFVHSGYGAEWIEDDQYGTPYYDRMWSHRAIMADAIPVDGVEVNAYCMAPGLWDVTGSDAGRMGVITHELVHILGVPDLYDTDGGGYGVGDWCLMGYGSWGFDDSQHTPSHMGAWAKMQLGWLNPYLLLPDTAVGLNPIETDAEAYKIESGYPAGEYLLIENRQNLGFDALLPSTGLAIWHIDETQGILGFNSVNQDQGYPGQPGWPANDNHYRVALLQADGDYDLEKGNNFGDAGDLFVPGDELSDTTTPDTKAYQDGTVLSNGNRIHDLFLLGPDVYFSYESLDSPSITPGTLPPFVTSVGLTQTLSSVGGVGPHTWTEWIENPSYVEVDLGSSLFAATGVPQGWSADEQSWLLNLPFQFPFYETKYDQVWVSSNGFIDLQPGEPDLANHRTFLPFAMRIAPLWQPLRTNQPGGDIFVDTATPGQVKVRWVAETQYDGDPCEFSVTLFASGDIQFDYGAANDIVTPAIGISRGQAQQFLISQHDGVTDLNGANSVRFELSGSQIPPGMTLTTSGTFTGAPTTVGTWNVMVRQRDAENHDALQSFTLEVLPFVVYELYTYPPLVTDGDLLTLKAMGATPGNRGFLYTLDVNGLPFFLRLASGCYDNHGNFTLVAPIPPDPGLQGLTLNMIAFEQAQDGVHATNPASVSFR